MPDERPALRGFIVRNTLVQVSKLPVAQANLTRARVDAQVLKELERASSLMWVPIEKSVQLTAALDAVLARRDCLELYRRAGDLFTNDPMSTSVVNRSAKLFGLKPKAILKSSVVTWGMISRNCGTQIYRERPSSQEADVVWSDVPEVATNSRPFMEHYVGALSVLFTLCSVKGTIDPMIDFAKRQIVLRIKWA